MDDGTMDSLEARIKRALGAVQEARQRTVSPFDAPSTNTGAKVCVVCERVGFRLLHAIAVHRSPRKRLPPHSPQGPNPTLAPPLTIVCHLPGAIQVGR